MSSVFISYRRADAQGWAGRLGADLAAAFGDVARFLDLASIPPGADFLLEIERSLADACAVLVLIGPRWLDLRDEQGRRRLDDPDDLVAAEVAKALSLGVLVIPVLLGGAAMPASADLPEPLRILRRRNGFELSDVRWEFDRDRLFAAIEAGTPLRRRSAGLELRDAEVGRVTGARGAVPSNVDVLKGAKVTGGKIGDIIGVEIAPPADRKA
jgi:hypothetical protein